MDSADDKPRFVHTAELKAALKDAPQIDAERFRADLDEHLDQTPSSRGYYPEGSWDEWIRRNKPFRRPMLLRRCFFSVQTLERVHPGQWKSTGFQARSAMERIGIEPMTFGLQSRRSPS